MNKSNILLILVFIIFTLTLSGCNSQAQPIQNTDVANTENNGFSSAFAPGDVQKVEIYHFHGTNQCYSCIKVGEYAEATVNTYFADELKSGKIVFGHINGELPENSALVRKYGATGSSLWIGVYTVDGKFKAEQNINVWYKINDKQSYMTYLKDVIDQKLAGK